VSKGILAILFEVALYVMNTSSTTTVLIAGSLIMMVAAIGHGKGDDEMIPVGEHFVEFELPAHDGSTVASADLEGKPFLLFFYPKADTPG
jgi:cytochrome oxidase Cu insertion factor (SCO1/SenC/PrrC family)